jgi:hypothetical protein
MAFWTGGGSILGILSASVKRLFGREGDAPESGTAPVERRRRWTRTLLLVPVLTALFFISVAELGHTAAGKAGRTGIIAALADPLALFAARSPGERGAGALLSTKPGGPAERVLSEVRDRDPAAGDPPADPVGPITPDDVAALGNGLPSDGALPGGAGGPGDGGAPGGGSPFFAPFTPPSFGGAPRDPDAGGPPPGGPGIIPPPPLGGVSTVPEPATWAMLILGFFGAGAALRRARRINPTCAR